MPSSALETFCIEITALATYGALAVERTGKALAAGFNYIFATSLASTLFLLSTKRNCERIRGPAHESVGAQKPG